LVYCAIGATLLLGVGYLAFHNSKPLPPDLTKLQPVFDEDFADPRNCVLPTHGKPPPTKVAPSRFAGAESFFDVRRFVTQFTDGESREVCSASPGRQYAVSNFACLLSCCFIGQGEVGWGFLYYSDRERYGVLVSMRPNREVEIAEYDRDSPASVQQPKFGRFQPPIAEPGGGLINLLVTLQGRKLSVFVNDRAVGDPILLGRGYGSGVPKMALWRMGKGEARAEVTRFALWQLPETRPETGQ
jgi:hypothetical protein